MKQGPPTVDLLSALSDTYSQLNQPADALKTLQQAQALDPDNVDLIMHCAALAADAGDSDDEVREYEKAYALEPQREGLRARPRQRLFRGPEYRPGVRADEKDGRRHARRLDAAHPPRRHQRNARARQGGEPRYYEQALHSPALTLEAALKLTAFFIDQQPVRARPPTRSPSA